MSNPSDTLPGLLTKDPQCARRRMGLPQGEILNSLTRMARVSRQAHPFPSLNVFLSVVRERSCLRFPYPIRVEQVGRTPPGRRSSLPVERVENAGSARLLSSLSRHESLQLEGFAPQQHVIDGPAQFARQNAQSLPLAVLLFKPREVFLSYRVAAQEQ